MWFAPLCFVSRCYSSLQRSVLCSADSQLGTRTHPAPPFLSRHQHHGQCSSRWRTMRLFCFIGTMSFISHLKLHSISLVWSFWLYLDPEGSSKYCPQKKGVLCPAGSSWTAVGTLRHTEDGQPRDGDPEYGCSVHAGGQWSTGKYVKQWCCCMDNYIREQKAFTRVISSP